MGHGMYRVIGSVVVLAFTLFGSTVEDYRGSSQGTGAGARSGGQADLRGMGAETAAAAAARSLQRAM